jgi:hypothetical protein
MRCALVAAIAVVALSGLIGLSGCSAVSFDVPDPPLFAADPAGPGTWGPLPVDPSPPMRVWIGVPTAVFTRIPTSRWPEYEPLSMPWEEAIWVPEHYDWNWDGAPGWMWLRGQFITRPAPGYEWNPPAYVTDEFGSYFVPGFFCPPPEPVACPACEARSGLPRSKLACRAGLSAARKHELARRAARPENFVVSR